MTEHPLTQPLTLQRRLSWPLCAIALASLLASCSSQTTPAQKALAGSDTGEQEVLWSEQGDPQLTAQALTSASTPLSKLSWASANSGYGPIERDESNGEKLGGDGHKMTVNGRTFETGFGLHSNSKMAFKLPSNAQTFSAVVGVDDEVKGRGSVIFQVVADGQKLFDSGKMTGSSYAQSVNVKVSGKKLLELVVTDAGDGLSYDHADWGDAALTTDATQAAAPATSSPSAGAANSEDRRYPADAVINVATRYGAVPDDGKDDTAALQKAISENIGKFSVLYFPKGTYNVSDTLRWKNTRGTYGSGVALQGENQSKTIIKLSNGAFGGNKKAVLYTASNQADSIGQGNNAFGNSINDLTVDTGSGNSGATGIDYVANNSASLRNLTIRSGDGSGQAGLGLVRTWPGPLLGKNLRVEGFDYGIQVKNDAYTQTFENVTLTGQRKAGIYNDQNVLSIRKLKSINNVPAIISDSEHETGVITLLDSDLGGGSGNTNAIINTGTLYARNVTTSGYSSALKQKGNTVPGNTLGEYVSDPRVDKNGVNNKFKLAVEETPEFFDNNLGNWANVASYRTNFSNERDDSDAIQKAIDSGKSTVYFPAGTYRLGKTVHIRGNVRHIIGIGAILDVTTGVTTFNNGSSPQAMLKVDGGSEPVIIDNFLLANWNNSSRAAGLTWIEHASSRTLVLRDLNQMANGKVFYKNAPGAGKLFIENVATLLPWQFNSPQDVWARQFNPENHNSTTTGTLITKNGGKMWIMGLKTEDPRVVMNTNGGELELLGGLIYPVSPVPSNMAAFVSLNTKLKLTYTTLQYNNPEYQVQVQDGNDAFRRTDMVRRNHHAAVALYLNHAASPDESGDGKGLTGQYYDNGYHTGDFTGLKTTRTDSSINFDWGSNTPSGTGLSSKDTMSVRWTGKIQPPSSGSYSFIVAKDGKSNANLWVNGKKIADSGDDVYLEAGKRYDIRMEYAHLNYEALIKLAWSVNGSVPQIVPSTNLYPN
ncbi:NPCBM/NEW2 domain-containing protein [Deinococcus sp.]|uniref:NPCBM/NEW2 domain-containing protein n=1 Tax=Deinococcus sp. TaxID=47478 RepID=UPI003B591BDB